MTNDIRVLAFTCSFHRPLMLRHCIMQIERQTYPTDHVVFVNSSEDETPDGTPIHYHKLLAEFESSSDHRLIIGYGPTKTAHENYLSALHLVDSSDYDLFLKIDDDDIYYANYVQAVVYDYLEHGWDYSGSFSDGILKGHRWSPDHKLPDLGLDEVDKFLGIPSIMPPTAAFSRKAIERIARAAPDERFDDIYWRRLLAVDQNMAMSSRDQSHFVYNVHGSNVSTGSWIK
ncbi:MAG: hypothetical protein ACR2PG_24895 [Hyphomicrobiaceae bacterium]